MTLDGKIAAVDRRVAVDHRDRRRALEAHRLRSQSDAVVVGIGTALADDPALDVRLSAPWPREPLRVVVDSRARLPVDGARHQRGQARRAPWSRWRTPRPPSRVAALESRGRDRAGVQERATGAWTSPISLARLFALDVMARARRGRRRAARRPSSRRGLVDRVAVFVAPVLLGGAAAPTAGRRPRASPCPMPCASDIAVDRASVGDDWLVEGDVRVADRAAEAMFTGLVEEVGRVIGRDGRRASRCRRRTRPRGQRRSARASRVNGVVPHRGRARRGTARASTSGPRRSRARALGDLGRGDRVNLERPLRLGGLAGRPPRPGARGRRRARGGARPRRRDGAAPRRVAGSGARARSSSPRARWRWTA